MAGARVLSKHGIGQTDQHSPAYRMADRLIQKERRAHRIKNEGGRPPLWRKIEP